MTVNLAARPFQNRRPKRRVKLILWSFAGLALLFNSWLFLQFWLGSSNGRDELRVIRERTDEQVSAIRDMQQQLADFDLRAQNEQVQFLNRKIAERTFPWSRLFDDIVDVLPRNVRLTDLSPSIPEQGRRRRDEEVKTSIDWIRLSVRGVGKTSDDVFDLVDAMFDHETFASPVLFNESDTDEGVNFDLRVSYRVAEPEPMQIDSDVEGVGLTATASSQLQDSGAGSPGSAGRTDVAAENGDAPVPGSTATAAAAPTTGTLSGSGAAVVAPGRSLVRGTSNSPPSQVAASENDSRTRATDPTNREAAGARVGAPPTSSTGRSAVGRTGSAVASGSEPTGAGSAISGSTASGNSTSGSATSVTGRNGQAPTTRTTEDIADERFGRDEPVAPRLPNSSGGGRDLR